MQGWNKLPIFVLYLITNAVHYCINEYTMTKQELINLNKEIQALPLQSRKSAVDALGLDNKDFFVDERDYNIYSIVRIGNQEWLGENLRYEVVGQFYEWTEEETYYFYDHSELEEAIPEGWELPSSKLGEALINDSKLNIPPLGGYRVDARMAAFPSRELERGRRKAIHTSDDNFEYYGKYYRTIACSDFGTNTTYMNSLYPIRLKRIQND